MAENELDPLIDDEMPDTPEDVAILYSWANIHGAKYRDFSASRREYRAQMRARAMEAQREAELRAAREREDAARMQEEQVRHSTGDSSSRRAAIEKEEAAMRAEVERLEAQRHAEAAELARIAAEEAEREAMEARRRAREQAARYAESDHRRRAFAGPQPTDVPGKIDDPYHFAGHVDPVKLANSGVRSSGLARARGSSATVRAVRPDPLPDPSKLIRDDVPSRVSQEFPSRPEVGAAYNADGRYDGRYETEREAEQRQKRYENRLFRDPLDPRFQSSSSSRPAFRPLARNTDPNVVLPRHEDVREGVDPSIYERIGAQELQHLRDEEHRRSEYNRAHQAGRHGPGHTVDPNVEQFTEPRPILESKAQMKAKEDAAARHHLHEEVERQLHHGHSGAHEKSLEVERLQRHADRDLHADEAWEREHAAAEARRKRERDMREESRIRQESAMREAAKRNEAERLREEREAVARERAAADHERAEKERMEREAREAEMRDRAEREAREREEKARSEEAARKEEERSAKEAVERRIREQAERDAKNAAEREAAVRASRARVEPAEEGRDQDRNAAVSSGDSKGRDVARRERSREIREAMLSSAVRPAAGYSGLRPAVTTPSLLDTSGSRPAWLHAEPPAPAPVPAPVVSVMNDTLQQSRERVAARWFALKELLGQSSGEHAKAQAAPQRETRTPTLCIISMAGGVGRTSMVATLGRTLSAMGEKVLLADTGSHGLLPYYFGARDLRPGVVRTFSPPSGSPDAPVYMVNFDTDSANYDPAGQDHIYSELQHATRGIHRVLLDLQIQSSWLVRRLAKTSPVVLVPLAPDMNSVLGIQSVERVLGGLSNVDGQLIQPYYVLNQFDASQPLHLDVREALRQKLGDRLLPIVIRRAPAVAEALAEGMTVMDYAPNSAVTEDYSQLASWIRNMTAPATSNYRGMRWSEG